jgi:hypothetical protein
MDIYNDGTHPPGVGIGMGTGQPKAPLDVVGGVRGSGPTVSLNGPCSTEGMLGYDLNNAPHQPVYCNGTVWMAFGSGGKTFVPMWQVVPGWACGSSGSYDLTQYVPADATAVQINMTVASTGGNGGGNQAAYGYLDNNLFCDNFGWEFAVGSCSVTTSPATHSISNNGNWGDSCVLAVSGYFH